MFAVFEALGRQYKVSVGDRIKVDRVVTETKNAKAQDASVGSKIKFPQVLLIEEGGQLKIGKPTVSGATIEGTVIEQGKDKKVLAFKKKRRKGYTRKVGHRRAFTVIEISAIRAA